MAVQSGSVLAKNVDIFMSIFIVQPGTLSPNDLANSLYASCVVFAAMSDLW